MNILLLMSDRLFSLFVNLGVGTVGVAVLCLFGYLTYCAYCRTRYPKGEGKIIECIYESESFFTSGAARKETLSQHNIDPKLVAHSRLESQKASPDFGEGHWECKIEYFEKK